MDLKEIDFTRWAAIGICIVCAAVIAYFSFSYLFTVFLPFFLAWCTSAMIMPPSRWIAKKLRISVRPISVIMMILAIAGVGILLFLIFSRILYEVQNFAAWAGEESGAFDEYINNARSFFEDFTARLPFSERLWGDGGVFSAWDGINEMLSDVVSEAVKNASASIPAGIASLLRALPKILLFVAVSVIASFYFCLWRDSVGGVLGRILPEKWAKKLPDIKKSIAGTALGYLRAYLLIFFMTFSELYVGLAILKVKYSFILAFLIALVDVLPVFGTGIVLVPWALVLLLAKNYYLGFGLLIMYAVILLVRQIAEPKIIGKSIGLDPLVTLIAMYAGFKLFGLFGMILGPAAALIIKTLIGFKRS